MTSLESKGQKLSLKDKNVSLNDQTGNCYTIFQPSRCDMAQLPSSPRPDAKTRSWTGLQGLRPAARLQRAIRQVHGSEHSRRALSSLSREIDPSA
jgi:hypothetical protein